MKTQITIHRPSPDAGPLPLYKHYPSQSSPQPTYIELECDDGNLLADYRAEIGNGVSPAEYHRCTLTWDIPSAMDLAGINALLDEIAPYAQQIIDGYEHAWDGSNYVGVYSREAQDTIDLVADICRRADATSAYEIYAVDDWFCSDPATREELLSIPADEIDAQAVRIKDDALAENQTILIGDIVAYIRDLQAEAADEED